ncbi:MAG: PKD domain-containing protein, partial [Thermoplasmata archaeon]|nr:PKD domain-containing protein [Thermoplasmata archaeon]
DYTLWILPCDFSQNATVSITNAAELVYGFTTVWLGAAGSIGLGVGEFLVWNFTLPSNVSWMEFGADLVGLPPELGLLDAAELASFLANPGAFNFSTLIDYGPPGPPVAGVVPGAAASPPAGPYAVVAYNSANISITLVFRGPLYTIWPGPATPFLQAASVASGPVTTVVGAEIGVAATALDSAGDTNPAGVTFAWSVLPATLGYVSDPTQSATTFVAIAAGDGVLQVDATWDSITLRGTAPIHIDVPAPFVLWVGANRSSGPVPLTVAFNSSSAGAATTPTYAWNFSDGSAEVPGAAVTHTFLVAGTYLVTLTAREPSGATATSTFTITALPEGTGRPLTVNLSVSPSSLLGGSAVAFLASASGGSPPYAWSWIGLPSGCSGGNVATVNCTLPTSGMLVVRAIATDRANQTASAVASVSIAPSAAGGPTSALGNVPLWLTATVAGALVLSGLAFALSLLWYLRGRRPPGTRASGDPPR